MLIFLLIFLVLFLDLAVLVVPEDLDGDLLGGVLDLPDDSTVGHLALLLEDSSVGFLVDGCLVVLLGVLVRLELVVVEEEVGDEHGEGEDGEADDDDGHLGVSVGTCSVAFLERTAGSGTGAAPLFASCESSSKSGLSCSTRINSFQVLTDDMVVFLTLVPPGSSYCPVLTTWSSM